MIKSWRRWLWMAGIAASLSVPTSARAQSGPLMPMRVKPVVNYEQRPVDSNRFTEIQVELAWMSDPVTFPYFLEAKVKGTNLELRGYVPSKAVRAQALSLAKLNCPLPVVDGFREHSSLAVRSVHRDPEHLKASVETALHQSFPSEPLNVRCREDGSVQVSGTVRSLEEKLAISQSLRRLHGCVCVINLTETADGMRYTPVTTTTLPPPVATAIATPAPKIVSEQPTKTSISAPVNVASAAPATKAVVEQTTKISADPRPTTPYSVFNRQPAATNTKSVEASLVKASPVESAPPPLQPVSAQPMLEKASLPAIKSTPVETRSTVTLPKQEVIQTKAELPPLPNTKEPVLPPALPPVTATPMPSAPVSALPTLSPAPAPTPMASPAPTVAVPPPLPAPPPIPKTPTTSMASAPSTKAPPTASPPASAPAPMPAVMPVTSKPAPAVTAPKTPAIATINTSQIKKRIETVIPGIRDVVVTPTSRTELRIACTLRPGDESNSIANQILSLYELETYRVDLQFQLPPRDHK